MYNTRQAKQKIDQDDEDSIVNTKGKKKRRQDRRKAKR